MTRETVGPSFKIIGLQRTGTNYLAQLLRANFVRLGAIGHVVMWKHEAPERAPIEALRHAEILMVQRHPCAWIESLTRSAMDLHRYHDLSGPGRQIQIRHGTYRGELAPVSLRRLCDVYSAYYLGWLDCPLRVRPIRHETLLGDPAQVVGALEAMGLRRRGDAIVHEVGVNHGRSMSADERERLGSLRAFDLAPEVIAEIATHIDERVWGALGYERPSAPAVGEARVDSTRP